MKFTDSLASGIIILIAFIFFLFLIFIIFFNDDSPVSYYGNESIKAVESFKKIMIAQEEYKRKDRDGDGILSYALFTPHLWISVDENNEQVLVDLIRPELAMAITPMDSYNGYVFKILHKKKQPDGRTEIINFKDEWAALAYTADRYSKTGMMLLTDGKRIWTKKEVYDTDAFPYKPENEGWIHLEHLEHR